MKRMVIFLSIVFLLLFIIAVYYDTDLRMNTLPPTISKMPISPEAITRVHALAVGGDLNVQPSESTLLDGSSFLFLLAIPSAAPNTINFQIIKTCKTLYSMDTNHSGQIDSNDLYFGNLALFHITRGQKIIPLSESDVRSIILDPSMLTKFRAGIEEKVGDTVGQALLTDGASFPIKVIMIDKKDLNNAINP